MTCFSDNAHALDAASTTIACCGSVLTCDSMRVLLEIVRSNPEADVSFIKSQITVSMTERSSHFLWFSGSLNDQEDS